VEIDFFFLPDNCLSIHTLIRRIEGLPAHTNKGAICCHISSWSHSLNWQHLWWQWKGFLIIREKGVRCRSKESHVKRFFSS